MRRLLIALALLLIVGLPAAGAQDATPTPPPQPTSDDLDVRVEFAVERAENAADRAEMMMNNASGYLGIFESVGVAVGIFTGVVVPLGVGIAGLAGFRGLGEARRQLEQAREQINQDLAAAIAQLNEELRKKEQDLDALKSQLQDELRKREQDLDTLKGQLADSAGETRKRSQNAILAQALLPLSERQYRVQDYTGAIDTYSRALKLDDDNPMIHYRLGYVFVQSGNLKNAEIHLTRALSVFPDFAPAMAALGYVYRRMGEKMDAGIDRDVMLNKAELHLLEALRLQPKLIDEDGESWYGSLGGLYRRRGQTQQAIEAYKQAGEVTPHSSYPFSNLALLYMNLGDREAMIRTYKRVERLAASEVMAEVGNYWGYADLVVARLALGMIHEAETILETTLATAPLDSPYMLESLIDTLQRLSKALLPAERPAVDQVVQVIHLELERRRALLAEGKTEE